MSTLPYWSKSDVAKFLKHRLCTTCKNRGVTSLNEAIACTSCRVFKRRGRPPASGHIAINDCAAEFTRLLNDATNEKLMLAAANSHAASHGVQTQAAVPAGPSREVGARSLSLTSTAVGLGPSAQTCIAAACNAAFGNAGAAGVPGTSVVASAFTPFETPFVAPFQRTSSSSCSIVRPAASYPRSVNVCEWGGGQVQEQGDRGRVRVSCVPV